jgi:hypothetical protein
MDGERKILRLKVEVKEFIPFLTENRKLIINETISACEYLLQTELDSIGVVDIEVVKNGIPTTLLECKVFKEDMEVGLHKLLKASIEEEEYEVSQRVKLLQDYMAILNAGV